MTWCSWEMLTSRYDRTLRLLWFYTIFVTWNSLFSCRASRFSCYDPIYFRDTWELFVVDHFLRSRFCRGFPGLVTDRSCSFWQHEAEVECPFSDYGAAFRLFKRVLLTLTCLRVFQSYRQLVLDCSSFVLLFVRYIFFITMSSSSGLLYSVHTKLSI